MNELKRVVEIHLRIWEGDPGRGSVFAIRCSNDLFFLSPATSYCPFSPPLSASESVINTCFFSLYISTSNDNDNSNNNSCPLLSDYSISGKEQLPPAGLFLSSHQHVPLSDLQPTRLPYSLENALFVLPLLFNAL